MKWQSAFQYCPLNYGSELEARENETQHMRFRNNLPGTAVRVYLSNRYSAEPLTLETVRINGIPVSEAITLAPDECRFTPALELPVAAGEWLTVSIYVREQQSIRCRCDFAAPGGAQICFTQGDTPAAFPETEGEDAIRCFFGFSAVQVYTNDDARLITAFGDSITHMSFITHELTRRLYDAYPGQVSLINCGIGGNRLTREPVAWLEFPNGGKVFGEAGVKRFREDVYGLGTPDTVLILECINDIMHPIQFEGASASPAAEVLEDGFRQVAEIAHSMGSRIIGCTLPPAGNDDYPEGWVSLFEAARLPLNRWLRTTDTLDGCLDYDAALRDPTRPGFMRPDYSLGDGLHPNEAAAKQIADTVDWKMLYVM